MSKKTKGSQVEDRSALASLAEAEAAAWLARLHADDRDAGDEAKFRDWLDRRPENREAFAKLTEAWDLVGGLAKDFPEFARGSDESGRDATDGAPERVFGRGEN